MPNFVGSQSTNKNITKLLLKVTPAWISCGYLFIGEKCKSRLCVNSAEFCGILRTSKICDLNLVQNISKGIQIRHKVFLHRVYQPHAMQFHDYVFFRKQKRCNWRFLCMNFRKYLNPLWNARLTRQPTLHAGSSSTRIMFLEYNYCKKENSFSTL